MAFSLGQKLKDGYVIEKELGRGGFGITYRAKSKNGEQVVIKTLSDEVQRSPDFAKSQEEFVNEAVKLAKCDHPHVVQVEKLFQEGALWCIVMEYISGENLASFILNRGVLPEADALRYISQIGAALELTHSKNMLHRDVKPANIMLRCREGKPYTQEAVLIDFGLARTFIPNQINSHTAALTSGYAPIEQYFPRKERGAYTDVYALAATLYSCLTQALPESALERAEEVRTRKSDPLVPPKQINSKISEQVNRAILQGMEIDATRRPQSVRKWLALLEIDHKNSFRNVDSQAPTIRIPGIISTFQEFFKQKAPKTPSPPPSIENNDYLDWNKQGIALYDLNKYKEAINSFDKALALNPDFPEAWNNRGNALYDLKKYEEAINSYDKALALNPDFDKAWYGKACCHALQGEVDLAIESLRQAIKLDPDYCNWAKTNSNFNRIRKDPRFQALINKP